MDSVGFFPLYVFFNTFYLVFPFFFRTFAKNLRAISIN